MQREREREREREKGAIQVLDVVTGTDKAQHLIDLVFSGVEAGGYIAVVEVKDVNVDNKAKWEGLREVYYAMRPGVIPQLPELNSKSAWYFSPVVYSTQSRKKEQVVEGSTLWIELDDSRINPFSITPRPSAVVMSSKSRYHVFWCLNQSISIVNLEHYNRRLAYSIGADKSGWDANQLLRLCVGLNLKRDPPETVQLIHLDPTIKYDLDMFAMLPEVPKEKLADIENIEPVPTGNDLLSKELLYAKYGPQMTAALKDLLARRVSGGEGRSGALWRIYNTCARIGMPASHCYALVIGTPNDKFTHDLRYLGAESLWRDVLAGYEQATEGKTDRGIIDTMYSIISEKSVPQQIRLSRLGRVLIDDMMLHGMFYQTRDGGELFYLDLTEGTGELIRVELRSQKLRRFILYNYAINPGTQEYMQLYEYIAAKCQDDEPIKVYKFTYYDDENMVLYVNMYNNSVLRITSKGYEIVPNGADSVLFLNPVNVEPYLPARRPNLNGYAEHKESLWSELVLSCANLTPSDDLEDSQIRHILYSWVLSLFFGDLFRVKPILLIHGEKGSGKTMFFKALMNVLLAPGSKPDAPYSNEDAFDNAVTNNPWICIDNLDEHYQWLPNKLALLATGFRIKRRKLYTNNESYTIDASCNVGITSREPRFLKGRDDVADRLIPIRVEPYKERMINEDSLIQEIIRNRSFLWGEIIEDLISIIGQLEKNGGRLPKYQGDFRQADFASFLGVTAHLKNTDHASLLKHIKKLQGIEALSDDPLAFVLRQWVQKEKNRGRKISATALHMELQAEGGGNEFIRRIPSGRGLGNVLNRYTDYLSSLGIIVTKEGDPYTVYSITLET